MNILRIQQLCFVSGVALATLGTASAAQAALIVVPTDLNPGDQYRLVFVTEGTRDATSSDINDYNTFVTNQATGGTTAIDTALDTALNLAGFNPNAIEWKVIGSTATVDARDNTGTNPLSTGVPIYLIDGNRVANNNADLWDGYIQTPINRTPTDTSLVSSKTWTGTWWDGATWSATGAHYLGWDFALIGNTYFKDVPWTSWDTDSSSRFFPVYGMSTVLTVPRPAPAATVPEPSSLLGFITLGGLMLLGGAVRKTRK